EGQPSTGRDHVVVAHKTGNPPGAAHRDPHTQRRDAIPTSSPGMTLNTWDGAADHCAGCRACWCWSVGGDAALGAPLPQHRAAVVVGAGDPVQLGAGRGSATGLLTPRPWPT